MKGDTGKRNARSGQKKKKDPNAPKRGLTAFFHFLAAKRDEYVKENPSTKNTEVVKALSEAWKNISDKEKKIYEGKAAEDRKRYEQEMKSYTPPAAAESDDDDDEPDAKSSKKKRTKDPNAPKRALSAYMFFSIEAGPKIRADQKGDAKGYMTQIAEAWKAADQATKAKYEAKAKEDKKRYDKEMADYKKGGSHAKAHDDAEEEAEAEEESAEDEAEDDEDEAPAQKKKRKMASDDDDE